MPVEAQTINLLQQGISVLEGIDDGLYVRTAAPLFESTIGDDAEEWAPTSFRRELDALLGHTVHHYAMIAAMLRHHGRAPDRSFGIAPSTLRYEMDASSCAQ
jgi:hypothetical protein